MANNSFLLCRSEVWPGESLGSYLVRLSRLNGYGAANEVERLCRERMAWDDKLAQPYRPETYEVISQLTKILPYDVYKMTGHTFAPVVTPPEQTVETIRLPTGEDVPLLAWGNVKGHLWGWVDVRYCPLCLQERPYHRRAWLPVMAAVCLEHQTLLARGCPQCGQVVRVQDVVSGRCPQCYFELADAPVQSVAGDAFGLWAQQAILHWLGLADAPISPLSTLPDQPPAVLYRMLFTLRPALLRVQRSRWPYWYRGVVSLPNQYDLLVWADMMRYKILEPKWAYLLAATAFKVLADWPEGFYAFLDAYRQRRDGRSGGTLRSSFGLVFGQCLERHWLSPPFQFVQEAFDRYLVERFTLNPSILHTRRYQESDELRRAFPFITTAEAARRLHTTPKMIRRLVRRGELIPYRPLETGDKKRGRKSKNSYQFKLVRRDEVEMLRLRWQTAVPLADVVSVLGVSKSVALDLREEGLLTAVRGPGVDEFNAWLFDPDSVAGLLAALEDRVLFDYNKNARAVNLAYAAQVLSRYGYNAAKLLTLIVQGRLRSYWGWADDRSLADLRVSMQSLEEQIAALREARPFISRKEIARRMGVKPYIVARWVKHGLIRQEKRPGIGWYFDREEAERFIAGHVFSDEAVELLQVGALTVQKWARNGRLRPVSGPGIDGGHRYLFRREDVNRLRPENRLTAPELAQAIGLSRAQLFQWIQQGKVTPVSGPGIDGMAHYLFLRFQVDEIRRGKE